MSAKYTAREKFIKVCKFEKIDPPLRWESSGFWNETIERWHKEGAPTDIAMEEYLGMDERKYVDIATGYTGIPFYPSFEKEIIAEDEGTITYRDEAGIIKKERKDNPESSMPQFIEFPVKRREDFDNLKWRFDADAESRYGKLEELKKEYRSRDFPLGLQICGAYGTARNLMGECALSLMFYDDPELIHDIGKHWLKFYKVLTGKILTHIDVDYILIWEDMAFKTAPLMGPDLFKKFILPYYKELIGHIKTYHVDMIMVDSDGNNEVLLPLFIEAGVNGFMPCEIAAGMDPVEIRKQYGEKLVLWGGIDKRELSKDEASIKREVEKRLPYLHKTGGYIPALDHTTPPDISLSNFKYFLESVRKQW